MEAKKDSYKFMGAFELFEPSMRAIWLNISTLLMLIFSFIGVVIIPISIAFSIAGIWHSASEPTHTTVVGNIISVLIGLAALISVFVLLSATYTLGLKSVRGQKVSLREALRWGWHYTLRMVGLGFLTGLIILVGLILFIVPGLFMIKRYILAPYYLVDKDMPVFEAMRQSAEDSKKFSGPIWSLVGVTFILGVVGIIPLIGFLASVGQLLYSFAPAKRYDEVQKALGHHHTTEKHHAKAAA